jgi:hypothetical protein
LLDREIGRLGPIEDFRGVDAELAISIEIVGSIAQEAAGRRICAPVGGSIAQYARERARR